MSDYSFLKSGFSNLIEPVKVTEKNREDIEIMLGLFTSNALINASTYVNYCGRNAVTKTDILYGLQYEVFEFLQREDLTQGLNEIREDYKKLKLEDYEMEENNEEDGENNEEDGENNEEDGENNEEDDDNENKNDYDIIQKEEFDELIIPDEEVEEFKRISEDKLNDDNREFINKLHNYNDTWSKWQPNTELEIILKNAINNIN